MYIAGVRVDDITWVELLKRVGESISKKSKIIIGYLNVHVWNMAHKYPEVKSFLNFADIVYCDGKGIQLGAKLLGLNIRERFTGAFFIEELAKIAAEKKWKVFVTGGKEGVAEKACKILVNKYPGFDCRGTHHGFIKGMEEKVVNKINNSDVDILFVGMGTPQQEEFILHYGKEINVPVIWSVGALFDYVAGVQKRAPEWMSEAGFEWLYRLMTDPGRLWKRYLIGNTVFLTKILMEKIKE